MTNFLLYLKDNAYVWAIVILISIALAFWGIVQNIKKKQLLFYVETNNIVEIKDRAVENISIYYVDKRIENLLVSKIALVNRGNVTINYSDIPVAAPLIIKADDTSRILSAKVLDQTNESSLVNISNLGPTIVEVKFDYLEKKDGTVIQIMHTGPIQSVSFSGKLKGGQIITPPSFVDSKFIRFKKSLIYSSHNYKTLVRIMIITLSAITIQYLLFPQNSTSAVDVNSSFLSSITNYMAIVVGVLGVLSFFSVSFNSKTRSLLPKKLREYFNRI